MLGRRISSLLPPPVRRQTDAPVRNTWSRDFGIELPSAVQPPLVAPGRRSPPCNRMRRVESQPGRPQSVTTLRTQLSGGPRGWCGPIAVLGVSASSRSGTVHSGVKCGSSVLRQWVSATFGRAVLRVTRRQWRRHGQGDIVVRRGRLGAIMEPTLRPCT